VRARGQAVVVRGRAPEHTIRCVVADDHPPILDSVTRYLEAAGFSVPASVADGAAALLAVEEHRPHVCIADLRMPKVDGIELTRRLATLAPETGVLVYSGVADAATAEQALAAGAGGFALKDGPLADLERAVETIAAGGIYVDPVLAARIASPARKTARPLSARERDVLRLLASGDSFVEIGLELSISPDTARAHTQRAMTKLGARTRTHAVALALRGELLV